MDSRRPRSANGFVHVLAAAGACLFVASCSTSPEGEASFALTNPSTGVVTADAGAASPAPTEAVDSAAPEQPLPAAAAGNAPAGELPDKIAYLPAAKPGEAFPQAGVAAAATTDAPARQENGGEQAAAAPEDDSGQKPAAAEQILTAAPAQNAEQVMTAADPAPAKPVKKRGFLASLFSANQAAAAPAPAKSETAAKPARLIAEKAEPEPLLKLASFDPSEESEPRKSTGSYGSDALPGVRQMALFEIKRKSGLDDDSDVDLHEEDEYGAVQIASAAGLARLAPNGLLKQRNDVDVSCLKPALVGMLRQIERHFGKKVVVTSGYRSPAHNRRVRGAKKSQHMHCAAADIQVPGVSKWDIAAYARSLPGRGGVGTYCHTASVHVDVGPERDWNWRCRRRKA